MNKKLFKSIVNKSQGDLKSWLFNKLPGTISSKGYLYRPGTIPILLCAHMDTVHLDLAREISWQKDNVSSPQGIGGDDRCGIYIILKILEKCDCHVAFFEDEEVGGIGSGIFADDICRGTSIPVDFVIEFDRKGAKDSVYYDVGSSALRRFVESTGYFEEAAGSFTDICHICPALGVAGVNLSSGYYKPHTTDEYVVPSEVDRIITEAVKLIRLHDGTHYEISPIRSSPAYAWDEWNEWGYDDICYAITFLSGDGEHTDYVTGMNDYEAIGKFLIDHPRLCVDDIIDFTLT